MIRERQTSNGPVHEKVFLSRRRFALEAKGDWQSDRHLRDLMIAHLRKVGFSTEQIGTAFLLTQRQVQNRMREMRLAAEYLRSERDD